AVLRVQQDEAALVARAATSIGLLSPYSAILALASPESKSLEQAAADLEEAARLRPKQAAPLLNLVRVYQRQGRDEDSQRAFWSAVEREAPPAILADHFAERARVLLALGRAEEALRFCREATNRQPDHQTALLIRGRALVQLD